MAGVADDAWMAFTEIAAQTGVARVTVRRWFDRGRFPNAKRDESRDDGRWLVPWSDVLAAGLVSDSDIRSEPEQEPQSRLESTSRDELAVAVATLARAVELAEQTNARLVGIIERLMSQQPGSIVRPSTDEIQTEAGVDLGFKADYEVPEHSVKDVPLGADSPFLLPGESYVDDEIHIETVELDESKALG